jgi:hypothetical protein
MTPSPIDAARRLVQTLDHMVTTSSDQQPAQGAALGSPLRSSKMRHVVRKRVVAAPVLTVAMVVSLAGTLACIEWLERPAAASRTGHAAHASSGSTRDGNTLWFNKGGNEATRSALSVGTRWVLALQEAGAAQANLMQPLSAPETLDQSTLVGLALPR